MFRLEELIEAIFTKVPPVYLIVGSTILFLFMGTLAFIVRTKAAKKPISPKRIILPPLFMSSGALMFLFKEFRVPPLQVLEAATVGMIFSVILIKTTNFERKDGDIYVKRSKAFLFILLGLLVLRLVAKLILSNSIDVGELGGMFWILAFGMIVPWRIGMLIKYKKIKKEEGIHE
ncbi:CcdC family protein [Sporosarcina limicola]|uniref:Membrane protein CcdC involved in cytochrome C biogenesis n=2 Tax=Sporosarcina limicola TaxID=34101 RepID=A0A927MG78_9BACL|nr:cytochrome c biogenesis protein CcdC [Sporosarcina limicola]MBE1553870.1 membrane protein CcdC involved in cytochrome C biogenesis [Sporosarcina limicola]